VARGTILHAIFNARCGEEEREREREEERGPAYYSLLRQRMRVGGLHWKTRSYTCRDARYYPLREVGKTLYLKRGETPPRITA